MSNWHASPVLCKRQKDSRLRSPRGRPLRCGSEGCGKEGGGGGGEVELELEPGVYQAPSLLGIHIVHNLILGSPSAQMQSDVWKLMEP